MKSAVLAPALGTGTVLASGTVALALYLLFTGQAEHFDVGGFLLNTSPYAWARVGTGLCVGLSVVGASW